MPRFGAAPRIIPDGAGQSLAYNLRVQDGDLSAGGIAAGVRSIIIPERLPHKAARWERKLKNEDNGHKDTPHL